MADLIARFNWVDLFILLLLVRLIYSATKSGFVNEFFKCLGIVTGVFFACHFYGKAAGFVAKNTPLPLQTAQTLFFCGISLLTVAVFRWFRLIVVILFKIEPHYLIERWIAMFLSIIRCAFIAGFLYVAFFLAGFSYPIQSIKNSSFFLLLRDLVPSYYSTTYHALYAKITSRAQGTINQEVLSYYEIKNNLPAGNSSGDKKRPQRRKKD